MHTRSATCVKAAGNLPGPTICQQIEGTQRDKGKHSNSRSRGEERDPLSAAVLCRLVEQILLWPPMEPQTPRLGPAHHLPSADGHSGSRCFWQIFYGNTETEIPAWPPLRVFHKAGWPLPRRRRYRHPETEEHSKLHILTVFEI